jgi:hypothetical protein
VRAKVASHVVLSQTILAEDVGADCKILARLVFHGSHIGWHAHAFCGNIDVAAAGIVKAETDAKRSLREEGKH